MTNLHARLVRSAAAVCCAAAIPLAALAQPATAPGATRDGSGPSQMSARWQDHGAKRHFGGHRKEHGFRAMLRGLDLSEEQRDKVFAVLHAQAPQLRANAKQRRSAIRELRALTVTDNFDEARAKALSDDLARSIADAAMIRSRSANEIYQALTPEQRRLVQERLARRGAHFKRG